MNKIPPGSNLIKWLILYCPYLILKLNRRTGQLGGGVSRESDLWFWLRSRPQGVEVEPWAPHSASALLELLSSSPSAPPHPIHKWILKRKLSRLRLIPKSRFNEVRVMDVQFSENRFSVKEEWLRVATVPLPFCSWSVLVSLWRPAQIPEARRWPPVRSFGPSLAVRSPPRHPDLPAGPRGT